jgi:hypothetical protein
MIYTVDKLKSDIGDCISRNSWGYTDEIRAKVESLIGEVEIDLKRKICTDDDIAFRKALYEKTYGRFDAWFSFYRANKRAKSNVNRYLETASEIISESKDLDPTAYNKIEIAAMLQREELNVRA